MHRPAEHVSFQQRFSASDDVAAVLAAPPNQILKVDTTDCTLGALLEILMLRRGADRALKVSDSSLRGRLIRGLLKSSKDSRSEGGVGVLRLHASGCNEADANDFAEAFHALLVTASVAKPAARRLSGALHELLNNVHEHAGDDVEGLGAFEVLDREAWMVVADSGRGVLGGYLESPLPRKPVGPEEALKWAVVDHRSRTGDPDRGTGFQTVIQSVRSLDGCIRVRSDAASIELEQQADQSRFLLREQGQLRGFVVSVLLRW